MFIYRGIDKNEKGHLTLNGYDLTELEKNTVRLLSFMTEIKLLRISINTKSQLMIIMILTEKYYMRGKLFPALKCADYVRA